MLPNEAPRPFAAGDKVIEVGSGRGCEAGPVVWAAPDVERARRLSRVEGLREAAAIVAAYDVAYDVRCGYTIASPLAERIRARAEEVAEEAQEARAKRETTEVRAARLEKALRDIAESGENANAMFARDALAAPAEVEGARA